MKQFKNITLLFVAALSVLLWSCNRDDVDPTIAGLFIEDYDLVQLTNSNSSVNLTITASDNEKIKEIVINIYTETGTEVIASNTLRQIINNINRITISVPFPDREIAPSGRYRVEYNITDEEGNTFKKETLINVVNYIGGATTESCEFPDTPLPAGKNTWVRVIAPSNTGEDDVYIVGDFMDENGGAGDWNPGDEDFKMTRVPNSNCFYIAVNLTSGQQLKFTRGGWDSVMKDENGNDFRTESDDPRPGFNGDGNIQWGTPPFEPTPVFTFTIPNWRDRVLPPPSVIPSSAIQSGKMTVVVDLDESLDKNATYHLVPEGATDLSNASPVYPLTGSSNQVAGAVDRTSGVNYVLIEGDDLSKVGRNAYAFSQTVSWDGQTNPSSLSVGTFSDVPVVTLGDIFVTGEGVGGWNNPVSETTHKFTKLEDGKYELVIDFPVVSNNGYIILSTNGQWNPRWGLSGGDTATGSLVYGNDTSPLPTGATGNHKIEIDFTKGTGVYTVTAQ